jgi:hypothetical protein
VGTPLGLWVLVVFGGGGLCASITVVLFGGRGGMFLEVGVSEVESESLGWSFECRGGFRGVGQQGDGKVVGSPSETSGIFRFVVLRGVGRRDDGKVTWKLG